jgi:hypothetical protein
MNYRQQDLDDFGAELCLLARRPDRFAARYGVTSTFPDERDLTRFLQAAWVVPGSRDCGRNCHGDPEVVGRLIREARDGGWFLRRFFDPEVWARDGHPFLLVGRPSHLLCDLSEALRGFAAIGFVVDATPAGRDGDEPWTVAVAHPAVLSWPIIGEVGDWRVRSGFDARTSLEPERSFARLGRSAGRDP